MSEIETLHEGGAFMDALARLEDGGTAIDRDDEIEAYRAVWLAGRDDARAQVAALEAERDRLRAALIGLNNGHTADDGQPCWCLTEHAHRKYGCEHVRAALRPPGPGAAGATE